MIGIQQPHPLPAAPRRNLAREVVVALRAAIIAGKFAPGEALAEPALAARFGVSRVPVREALIELEREGLVQFDPNSRTRVRTLTAQDGDEIVEARTALETMGARRAATHWTAEDSAEIRRNIAAQAQASTLAELTRLDVELHEYIMRRGGNGRLLALWRCIRPQFEMWLAHVHRLQARLDHRPRRMTVDLHRRLLRTLESRDGGKAAAAMSAHIAAWHGWLPATFPLKVSRPGCRAAKPAAAGMLAVLAALVSVLAGPVAAAGADADFFESKVRPLLVERCFECHSHEKKIKGGLVLDSRSGWEKGGDSGPALVPGRPEESRLIQAISHADKDLAMPPKKKLSDDEIAVLTAWVKMGAPDPRLAAKKTGADLVEGRKHWAFQPVTQPVVPASAFPEISRSPIDAFIFAALARQGLRPAVRADRATLLRRATFDLTGLPPTAEESAAFADDPRPDEAAFAQVVERLLASPAYGEKWGRHWLDLAHYADTTGCSADWPIDDMWRYRDWVVAAFNGDQPFDRFLTEQLAGDLLAADMLAVPGAVDERAYRGRIVATGFLATAKRFGSDPGSYDHLTIGDSLDTTWKALQGLTLGCARCHDHKFDPLPASDYYALYGILASSLFPYAGAELNHHASLLVPLAPRAAAENSLDQWNRALPAPAAGTTPRSVLASFGSRWGFEDHEKAEQVVDRAPVSPWISHGGVAVRAGNSPFAHLLPLGVKLVEMQATARQAELLRRVRWEEEGGGERSLAFDFQLAKYWDGAAHRLRFAWRPEGDPAGELELAAIAGSGLALPGGGPVALVPTRWHHLALTFTQAAAGLRWRLWDERGRLLADARAPFPPGAQLRAPGDLVVRFEADAVNDKREACVRLDNFAARGGPLPEPAPPEISAAPAPPPAPAGSATPEEIKRQADDEKKARDVARAAVYREVLPRQPEMAFAMWEGTPRDAAIQKRGEPASPGAVAPRRNPLIFGGQPVAQPRLESGRRDLARWLLDESNPLTLRVLVNRIWQWHFGRGIVATPNDFGHQGAPPTHPELLDHLVQRFRAGGLSIKTMHREIMRSHAYCQAATPAAGSHERDPDNRWLAHFSPRRLTAEEVRDAVLAVSGLLDPAGAGHRQPFPPRDQRGWTQHRAFSLDYEAKYRGYEHRKRSIYLPVVRLVADPFLSTFDMADSNQSVAQRGETAVPLQALALLNAPFVIEAADALGALAANQSASADAVALLHRKIFGVEATAGTAARLTSHLEKLTAQRMEREEALAVIAQSLLGSNTFVHLF